MLALFLMGTIILNASSPSMQPITNTIHNKFSPVVMIDATFFNSIIDYKQQAHKKCRDFVQQKKESLKNSITSLYAWILGHKLRCVVSSLACVYIGIQSYGWYLQKQLAQYRWSQWHAEKSLEELFAIGQQQLAQSLMLEIQQHYITANTPTDFLQPLIRFMHDVDQEILLLTRYKQLTSLIAACHLSRISLMDAALINSCDARLQRLAYIKGLFLSWIAQYKLERS